MAAAITRPYGVMSSCHTGRTHSNPVCFPSAVQEGIVIKTFCLCSFGLVARSDTNGVWKRERSPFLWWRFWTQVLVVLLSNECLCPGRPQVIQSLSGVDKDEPLSGHRFHFSLDASVAGNPNFTLRDNKGSSVLLLLLLPVVVL